MKLSKYNYILELDNNDIVIYNTITSGVLLLKDDYANQFRKFPSEAIMDQTLRSNLTKGGIIIEDTFDELKFLELQGKMAQYSTNSLKITIAPTLDCNFRCPYCYEKGIEHHSMDQVVQEKVVEFVKQHTDQVNAVGITWYGGEPLLEIDTIEKISNEIIDVCKEKEIKYAASIVTNGYLLSRSIAERLIKCNVSDVQITIDGDKASHNSRRILYDGSPTYDVILNNLSEIYDLFRVNIRINIDKKNFVDATKLLADLEKRNLKNKVFIYIAPVESINGVCSSTECFTVDQFSEVEIDFLSMALDNGFNLINIPSSLMGYCGAVSANSYIIDPEGTFYLCWNQIGRKEYSIGGINSGLKYSELLTEWLLYTIFDDDECKACKMMPICYGGCPYHVMNNNRKCKSIRFNADDYLKLLLKSRTMSTI